jgi:hypothetical protein
VTVSRPLCAVCFTNPRESASARCHDCGPGRIQTPSKPPSALDRAAQELGEELQTDTGLTGRTRP